MSITFKSLNKTIIKCKKCPRLVKFIKKISTEKRKQNIKETYWGKPVTGFGDENAKLIILGLAPAAHGGTRTGRAFTGDKSGDFLFDCLYETKISNQSVSTDLNDGLKIKSTFITNVIKCVPPDDKPLNKEIENCSKFLESEILHLKNLKIILTLGRVAFDKLVKIYKKKYFIKKKIYFKHGKKFIMPDKKILFSCYHPSPRNVNTGLLNKNKMKEILISIKKQL
jgi:uracil-DNA glycosylase family 4